VGLKGPALPVPNAKLTRRLAHAIAVIGVIRAKFAQKHLAAADDYELPAYP
jgi:hypothetical protein